MKNNNQIFGFAQKLGKALMTPIAVLPAAAILLRFGSSDLLTFPGWRQQEMQYLETLQSSLQSVLQFPLQKMEMALRLLLRH